MLARLEPAGVHLGLSWQMLQTPLTGLESDNDGSFGPS